MRCVDLFSGYGGFTLGAEWAGQDVVWAANHWPLAVEAHALNHPRTEHSCQDLRQADWTSLPDYDLLLASPACQGHSTASQPKRRHFHDALRATAFAVVDCADVTEPDTILVENVPSFRNWRLYPHWRDMLVTMGYEVEEHVLTASHYGVPQRRRRLFVLASKVGASLSPRIAPEPAFGPCVQWGEGEWRPITSTSEKAQERINRAKRNHGPRCLSQHVTGHPGVSLDEPIRTITTMDQWVVVDGDNYRPLTITENGRAMSFPDTYQWPARATRRNIITGLGNAVPPVMASEIIREVA